jgi:periplasmic divalent cation tolerance protein
VAQDSYNPLLLVITTVSSEEDARRIASNLVEQRLVACAQISPVESIYRWKDGLQQETEWRLVLKTTDAAYNELEAELVKVHPYELPAIYSVPVTHTLDVYDHWVHDHIR